MHVPVGTRRVSRVYAASPSTLLSMDGTGSYPIRVPALRAPDVDWPEGLVAEPAKTRAPKTADEWVRRNFAKIQKHPGKWVAVTSHGIVGVSTDFDEAYGKAKAKGIDNPLVFKAPSKGGRTRIVSARRR